MNNQEKEMRSAFTETPDVLSKIKESPRFKVPEKEKRSIFSSFKLSKTHISFASILILALVMVFLISPNENSQVYASTVTIDINPSIEITLDEDDLVITVTALNDDGDEVIDRDINYAKMTLDEVVDIIIDKAIEKGYIDPDNVDTVVLLDVKSRDEVIKDRVQAKMEAQLQRKMDNYQARYEILKTNPDLLTRDQRIKLKETADELGISNAKLVYILELKSLDTNNLYTIRELSELNTRELYQVQQQLQNGQNQNGNQN